MHWEAVYVSSSFPPHTSNSLYFFSLLLPTVKECIYLNYNNIIILTEGKTFLHFSSHFVNYSQTINTYSHSLLKIIKEKKIVNNYHKLLSNL